MDSTAAVHGGKRAGSAVARDGTLDMDRYAVKVGETLAGRYELRQVLSSGRCTLFIAHDRREARPVAVKVFDTAHVSPDDLRRYADRLAAGTTVSHPAVVIPRVQIAVSESPPFVVGEVLQGEDLGGLCAHLKVVPWARALEIARGCADGLVALAAATGAAHRALRPGNVWITASGQIQILDFGIAELGAPPVRPRLNGVFVEYRAPEQLEGAPGDARSDVFSMGVLLFEMVTGAHPFSGPSAAAVAIKLLTQPPPTPSQLAPHIQLPVKLAELIVRALSRRPKDRFADAASMAGELAALLPAAASVEAAVPPAPRLETTVPASAPQSSRAPAAEPEPALKRGPIHGLENTPPRGGRNFARSGREPDVSPIEDRTLAMPHSGRPGQVAAERTEVLPRSGQASPKPILERTERLPQVERPVPGLSGERTELQPKRSGPTLVDDEARTQMLRRTNRPSKPVSDDAQTQALRRFDRPSPASVVDEERTQMLARTVSGARLSGEETLILPERPAADESTENLPQPEEGERSVYTEFTHAFAGEPRHQEEQRGHNATAFEILSTRGDAISGERRFLIVLNLVLAMLLLAGWLWFRG